jgi:hypothetical protein
LNRPVAEVCPLFLVRHYRHGGLAVVLVVAVFIGWRKGWITMRLFCCVLSVALFVLAAVMAFDTDNQFRTVSSNVGLQVVANLVRGLAALGFCLGGGCAVIGAVLSRPSGRGDKA